MPCECHSSLPTTNNIIRKRNMMSIAYVYLYKPKVQIVGMFMTHFWHVFVNDAATKITRKHLFLHFFMYQSCFYCSGSVSPIYIQQLFVITCISRGNCCKVYWKQNRSPYLISAWNNYTGFLAITSIYLQVYIYSDKTRSPARMIDVSSL